MRLNYFCSIFDVSRVHISMLLFLHIYWNKCTGTVVLWGEERSPPSSCSCSLPLVLHPSPVFCALAGVIPVFFESWQSDPHHVSPSTLNLLPHWPLRICLASSTKEDCIFFGLLALWRLCDEHHRLDLQTTRSLCRLWCLIVAERWVKVLWDNSV